MLCFLPQKTDFKTGAIKKVENVKTFLKYD
jgi:hypothetical protein